MGFGDTKDPLRALLHDKDQSIKELAVARRPAFLDSANLERNFVSIVKREREFFVGEGKG